METPKSLTASRLGRVHEDSPTLSSRKKALFGRDNNKDDTDLGPMTPIRFRSERKDTRKSNPPTHNINSFRNLFGNESPESDRSLSPDFMLRFTNNGRYELLPADPDKENRLVDEETRFSFHSIPETPSSSRLSAEENAQLDESNSNSLSQLMSSDLNLVDKRTKPCVLRTPSVSVRSSEAKPTHVRSLGPAMRRTLRPLPFQEHNDTTQQQDCTSSRSKAACSSPSPWRSGIDSDQENEAPPNKRSASSRARTSLQFNNVQPISTKSFYSSSSSLAITERPKTPHPPATASISKDGESKVTTPPAQTKTGKSASKTPHKSAHKTPHKSTMRKRSKSFSSTAPRLGQRGVCHKIRKPSLKKPSPPKAEQSKPKPRAASKKEPKEHSKPRKQRAIAGGTKSCPTTPKSRTLEEDQASAAELSVQMARVADLLRAGQQNLKRARPLSLTRSMTDLSTLSGAEADSSSSDEDDSPNGSEELASRKFFRSGHRKRSTKKVYKHFNSISLTVRSGGKRKLSSFPVAPKRQRMEFDKDASFDFELEQLEVDDLINRLDQGYSVLYSEPDKCETPSVSDDDTDDDPIPLQSNIIYVPPGELEMHDTVDEMDCDSNDPSNMAIIQHDPPAVTQPELSEDLLNAMIVDNACDIPHQFSESHDDSPEATSSGGNNNQYYPIFYKDQVKELWRGQQMAEHRHADVFSVLRETCTSAHKRPSGTGQDQYQIDAGQRAYGAVRCTDCGLVYSRHEPEEELIHDNFHRSQAKLVFGGWTNERLVTACPEWDVTGRILVVEQTDSRHWHTKVHQVLEVVDTELGYATQGELPGGAWCVYLAVARSTILGICVVESLQSANRMVSIAGLHGSSIDCYSSEYYPARCGVSRIWVSPKYRRLGVGRKLIDAIRAHYILGCPLTRDDIAFGAPTENGKLFAESVTGRKDFLVYL
ncbi:N-acetyltransferase eco-like [Anopheles albimanus]|uniref:N-acetyltransferase domain-containing protein n=1 Tax=Anopheles albimanus TaxID=7167 RepID=A0A182FKN2_ANOAL|nr:N-acetyltransferase eco-like [Anopheles albimanus]